MSTKTPTPLAVKQIPIGQLHAAAWNANVVSEDTLARIRRSIKTFGIVENTVVRPLPSPCPVCENEGHHYEVLSGNHRLELYREFDVRRVPAHVIDLDDAHARVLAQTLNRTRGVDNPAAYRALLEDVLTSLEVTDVIGFLPETERSITSILAAAARPAVDDTPPTPTAANSKPGEAYELGPHRLVCGDVRDPAAWELLLAGEKAGLLITDPPYGVDYASRGRMMRFERGEGQAPMTIENDDLGDEGTRNLVAEALRASALVLDAGSPFYVCSPAGPTELAFRLAIEDAELELRQCLVWVKDSLVLGRQDYQWRHESILYGWAPGRHKWNGGRSETTVWEIERPKRSDEHPTMKPVALYERAIINSTDRDAIVIDPFAGSGTVVVACEQLGRRAHMIELDPAYCDVIRTRYANFTGRPELLP